MTPPRPRSFRIRNRPVLFVAMLAGLTAPSLAAAADAVLRPLAPVATGPNATAPVNLYPSAVVPMQIDGDGAMDAAVLTGDDSGRARVTSWLGDGRGGFAQGRTMMLTALGADKMVALDFTRDGYPDLALGVVVQDAPGLGHGEVWLAENDRQGGFGAPRLLHAAVSGGGPHLEVADVNGDAIADLVSADLYGGPLRMFVGGVGGGFTEQPPGDVAPGGILYAGIATGDVNGDGRDDVVAASELRISRPSAAVFLSGAPGAAFVPLNAPTLDPRANKITGITLIDIDRDGRLDLLMSSESIDGRGLYDVLMYRGTGTGAFSSTAEALSLGTRPALTDTRADLNGDGYIDPVTIDQATLGVRVGSSVDSGGLNSTFIQASPTTLSVAAGDLNKDGRDDLIFVDTIGQRFTAVLNETPFPGPVAATGAASGVTKTAVTLNGVVTSRRHVTNVRFEYGPTTAYGSATPEITIPAGRVSQAVTSGLSGLFAGDTLHYRVVATNRFGTSVGADRTVTPIGLVERVRFRPLWRNGLQLGTLEVVGLPRSPGKLTVTLRRANASRVLMRRVVTVPSVRSLVRYPLPRTLTPGAYHVRVVGPDGGTTVTHLARLTLAASKQGYARVSISAADGGKAVSQFRYGRSVFFVRFQFLAEPVSKPRRVTPICTGPRPVRFIPLARAYERRFSIGIRAGSRKLPRGTYTCSVKVRSTVVGSATVRIR